MALVQQQTAAALSLTLASPTTAGNTLVVKVAYGTTASATVSSVTIGGAASNFAQVKAQNAANGPCAAIWVCPNVPGGQTAVAVTLSAGSINDVLVAEEYSALGLAVADQSGANSGTGTSWTVSGAGATSSPNEVWSALVYYRLGSVTLTGPGAPWVNTAVSSGVARAESGEQVTTATGTPAYAGTSSASQAWAAVIATFKAQDITVALPVAQLTINAFPVTPLNGAVNVALPVAQLTINAFPVTPLNGARTVALPAAQVTVNALAVKPVYAASVALPAARVTVNALPVTPKIYRPLLLAIASRAGTDDFGNAFPQGMTSFAANPAPYTNLNTGTISFGATAGQFSPATIGTQNTPGFLDLNSGQALGGQTATEVTLESSQGGNPAQLVVNGQETVLNTALLVSGLVTIATGNGPFTPNGSAWTALSTGGATGYARYLPLPWNVMLIDVELSFTGTGTFDLGNLSPKPSVNRHFPLGVVGANMTGRIFVSASTGDVQVIIDGSGSWSAGACIIMPTN